MPRMVFCGDNYQVSHTFEQGGKHNTRPEEYYSDHFIITVLLHGSGNCFVEGNCYSISDGDAILLRANELRRFSFKEGGLHERMSIYISPSIISPLWDSPLMLFRIFKDRPHGFGNKLHLSGYLMSPLDEIKNLLMRFADNPDDIAKAEMQLSILRLLVRLYSAEASAEENNPYAVDPEIYNICQYINNNLTEKLTHQQIGQHCGVSRYQLTDIFHRCTGMTVTEYITQKRLIRVSELVSEGSKIESAAISAGFHNYTNFYKAFIKYKGVSPKQYFTKKN
ncbi:MAG: helix-turn-helix transcriptional regulator [Clostridia bacterium]|nr:helix-turn-helix transcriptional regulator [Clostridia bacterium]